MQVLTRIEWAGLEEWVEKAAEHGIGPALDVGEDAFETTVELTVEVNTCVEVLNGTGVLDARRPPVPVTRSRT